MPYVQLPGVSLWYHDSGGGGKVALFVHAASGSTGSWLQQIPAFTTAGYRCVTYDRRGWGRSRADGTGEQPGSVSEDLHGLVNYLGLERVHLIGTANGAACAVDYAVAHPERVRSLTLADGTGGVQDADYQAIQRRVQAPEIQSLPAELRELGPSYRGLHPEGVHRWLEIEHASRPKGGQGPQQRRRSDVSFSLLGRLGLPMLVLCGSEDLLTPPALMRILASRIPGCQFAMIPEAGHGAFWEQPELWNELVLRFLDQN